MEIDLDFATKVAGAIVTVGTGFLGLIWKGGRWLSNRLFNEEAGLLTRLTNAHLRLVDALQTMPDSMRQIQETDQKQTELLKQIVESQVGKDSHPRILHEKLNLMIDAKIKIKQAFREFMANNREVADRLLNEAESLLTKAREL